MTKELNRYIVNKLFYNKIKKSLEKTNIKLSENSQFSGLNNYGYQLISQEAISNFKNLQKMFTLSGSAGNNPVINYNKLLDQYNDVFLFNVLINL